MNPRAAAFLDSIRIASPCTADWNQMEGDDRRRFCRQCQLHVHDLSAMTRVEAEALLAGSVGQRVCVRLYRRADGRVLTRDCPVGFRQRLRRAWVRAAALVAALWTAGCARDRGIGGGGSATPTQGTPALQGEMVMGDVAPPPPPPVEMGKVGPARQDGR